MKSYLDILKDNSLDYKIIVRTYKKNKLSKKYAFFEEVIVESFFDYEGNEIIYTNNIYNSKKCIQALKNFISPCRKDVIIKENNSINIKYENRIEGYLYSTMFRTIEPLSLLDNIFLSTCYQFRSIVDYSDCRTGVESEYKECDFIQDFFIYDVNKRDIVKYI